MSAGGGSTHHHSARKGSPEVLAQRWAEFNGAGYAESPEILRDVNARDLQQRYPTSPYTGYTFRGAVTRTLLRGQTIFRDGRRQETLYCLADD